MLIPLSILCCQNEIIEPNINTTSGKFSIEISKTKKPQL